MNPIDTRQPSWTFQSVASGATLQLVAAPSAQGVLSASQLYKLEQLLTGEYTRLIVAGQSSLRFDGLVFHSSIQPNPGDERRPKLLLQLAAAAPASEPVAAHVGPWLPGYFAALEHRLTSAPRTLANQLLRSTVIEQRWHAEEQPATFPVVLLASYLFAQTHIQVQPLQGLYRLALRTLLELVSADTAGAAEPSPATALLRQLRLLLRDGAVTE